MGTVPTLRTWTSGERITGTKLNEIRDALSFAYNPPRVHLGTTGGQDCANGVATRVLYTNTLSDTDSMYRTPGLPRVQTEGRFQVILGIGMPPASYSSLNIMCRLNSGGVSSGGTNLRTWNLYSFGGGPLTFVFERDFVAPDYLEVYVTQTSGATRTLEFPSLATFVQMRWISQ